MHARKSGSILLFGLRRLSCLQRSFFSVAQSESKSSFKSNLLLAIPIVTFGLGTWQVYRLQWKKNLIKELETKTSSPPVELPLDPDQQESMIYRRVKINGEFDHANEMYLGPRAINKDVQGLGSNQVGFQVITPFKLAESGEKILVNRGWVPKSRISPTSRKAGQVDGLIEMTGIVRKGEKKPAFVNASEIEKSRWHFLDVASMASAVGALPIIVDSDAQSSVEGGPIGGQTRIALRNEHLQYIITWYGLSAATLYMFYQLRRRPGAMFSRGPKS